MGVGGLGKGYSSNMAGYLVQKTQKILGRYVAAQVFKSRVTGTNFWLKTGVQQILDKTCVPGSEIWPKSAKNGFENKTYKKKIDMIAYNFWQLK